MEKLKARKQAIWPRVVRKEESRKEVEHRTEKLTTVEKSSRH